ncbi:hypothetical protein DLAC_08615 [Tieghemostelium lacteum]|uniref:Peptidase M66 domain-containing protein n=1 Tax=Tieghemostelium lacteum TaxID=361077 RepID=A0A151Z7U0_TIELA|nr:hypothetical protein DLAC_08615 [Tieghemostelium lacteum]|eukprot:KYQ90033.1 hypothetical protein DLAC_08615 [Tieghemostelium lacteum]
MNSKIIFVLLLLLNVNYIYCVKLSIVKLIGAQSHLIPQPNGLSWTLVDTSNKTISKSLHLTGGKSTLLIFEFGKTDLVSPSVQAFQGSTSLGTQNLLPPNQLAPTESNGTAFSTTAYSVNAPLNWIVPGVTLKVSASNYETSDAIALNTGCTASTNILIFPLYLFGANFENSANFSTATSIPEIALDELKNKWPVSEINAQPHPSGGIVWPSIILPPNGTHPAFLATASNQQRDGFEIMGILLGLLGRIYTVYGDSKLNTQLYGPISWKNSSGIVKGPDGGLGTVGGSCGVGDLAFAHYIIHELGHAFGISHSIESYDEGRYPYVNGSLLGSQWGYDTNKNQLLSTVIPTSASHYASCKKNSVLNAQDQCVKQSVMDGGARDRASGYRYAMFADYEAAIIQAYFEGTTTKDATTGVNSYSGGKVFRSQTFSSGYARWDSIDKKFVEYTPTTTDRGLYGINGNLPVQKNVPVYTFIASVSLAGTKGASILYPPLYAQNGALIQYFDPTSATDLDLIKQKTGVYYKYCYADGCDFTYRITYQDSSVSHVIVQDGLRPWLSINGTIDPQYYNATASKSQKSFVVNIPASKSVSRFEILYTPNVYVGLKNTTVTVLIDYDCKGQGKDISCSIHVPPSSSDSTTSESESDDISISSKIHINLYIGCGYAHSVLCTDMGDVYSWGIGNYLGLGINENISRPKQIESLLGVIDISCGHYHTVATTDLKNIYSWGQGEHMKLGHGRTSPRNIEFFINENVRKIFIVVKYNSYKNRIYRE